MISLDEDYLGFDDHEINVRGLKVCGGLVARLTSNRLVGAHFTSITTTDEIYTSCAYLRFNFMNGGSIADMYFISNEGAWAQRGDKYRSISQLSADLKDLFGFNGNVKTYDKNQLGLSIDIKVTLNGVVHYRETPNPDPTAKTDGSNVRFVKTAGSTPIVHGLPYRAYDHRPSQSAAAYTVLPQGNFTLR